MEDAIYTLKFGKLHFVLGYHVVDASTQGGTHEVSNNVVCATSKVSDQPAHTRSLIKAFASRLNIL